MAQSIASKQSSVPLGRDGQSRQSGPRQERGRRPRSPSARNCASRASSRSGSRSSPTLFKGSGKVTPGDIAHLQPSARHHAAGGHPAGAGLRDRRRRPRQPRHAEADPVASRRTSRAAPRWPRPWPSIPLYFDDLYVNLVEVGEHSGSLDSLLDKVATYKEKTEAIKKKIKKALFYPAAVVVVAIIVTTILLIFVIPEFEALFKGFGADLPAFTRHGHRPLQLHAVEGLAAAHRRRRRHHGLPRRQEALAQAARGAGPGHAEAADHRADPREGRDCALLPHAVHDVQRRRAAGGGPGVRGRRHRQRGLREGRAGDEGRGRHRPAAAAGDGEHRPVSRTW